MVSLESCKVSRCCLKSFSLISKQISFQSGHNLFSISCVILPRHGQNSTTVFIEFRSIWEIIFFDALSLNFHIAHVVFGDVRISFCSIFYKNFLKICKIFFSDYNNINLYWFDVVFTRQNSFILYYALIIMSLDHHDYQEDTQESIPSAEHQEIDVNTIDNINEEQSKNVDEVQFDNWFNKGLKNLTNGPWFFGMFTRYNKQDDNVFAKVDTNDDNKISSQEYNAWIQDLKQWFEQDAKNEFVKNEQDEVKAELNEIDNQKNSALDAMAFQIQQQEIQPYKSSIIEWFVWENKDKALWAITNPQLYALAYQEQRNKEHAEIISTL